MSKRRSDTLYIEDILDCCDAIASYCDHKNFETFQTDRMLFSATLRELEVIGEAIGKITDTCKERHPEIAWRMIKDFRNVLAHEYFGVDAEIVWDIVKEHIPLLHEQIKLLDCHRFSTVSQK